MGVATGVAVAVAVGVGVTIGVGVAVGVELGIEVGVGVDVGAGVAVDGCRWHWQRQKAAKPSAAVVIPFLAKYVASAATNLLCLTGPHAERHIRPMVGILVAGNRKFSSGICIGI